MNERACSLNDARSLSQFEAVTRSFATGREYAREHSSAHRHVVSVDGIADLGKKKVYYLEYRTRTSSIDSTGCVYLVLMLR